MAKTERQLERDFQKNLIREIKTRFPGSMVLKNDSSYIQGIPDLLVLIKDRWFALEVKAFANAKRQPNQPRYVEKMNEMSFARFIYPENKEEVLNDMAGSLES